MLDDQTVAAQLRKPSGEIGKQVAEKMNENNAFLYQQAFAMIEIAAKDHVLEIGFGNGKYLGTIAEQATKGLVSGIDFSDAMVEEAIIRNKSLVDLGRLEIRKGCISLLPYADNTFDKVLTLNTIYFLEDPHSDLRQVHRVLKPGGICCIGLRTGSTMRKHAFTKYGFALFELPDIIHLLQDAGFWRLQFWHQPDRVAPAFDALCVAGLKG